jgi:hypothetical protein
MQLSQEHSMKLTDIARRSLRLHFDNSRCHTTILPYHQNWIRGNDHLKCKWVRHPPYSPDLAVSDFYLFGVLKRKLQSINVSDDDELKSEILTIF